MHLTLQEKQKVQETIAPIDGWLSTNEAMLLYLLAKHGQGKGEIVEIGSFKGKSTVALGLGITASKRSGKVWAVDPHKGVITTGKGSTHGETYKDFINNIHESGIEKHVHPLVSSSVDAAAAWSIPIRLAFLDGLHDYEHTKKDYEVWSPFVSEGIIAFHDGFCGELGVGKVIREYAFRNPRIVDIGTVTSILYIVIGKPTRLTQLRVWYKKLLVRTATYIHLMHLPWIIQRIVIHGLLRLLLITPYTKAIY